MSRASKKGPLSDLTNTRNIRRIAIVALFSDNMLVTKLVLKGGNALDIIHNLGGRASIDLDFSMHQDFNDTELKEVKDRVTRALTTTFSEYKLSVFDVSFYPRPAELSEDMKDFWGGYKIEFKIIDSQEYQRLAGNLELLRKSAIAVGDAQRRNFEVEISKHEFTDAHQTFTLDGFAVYAYSLEMIVAEKLRAICQQHESYRKIVKSSHSSARARDFFDIHLVLQRADINIESEEFEELLRNVFGAKRVPLSLLGEVVGEREKHRSDFSQVKDTVPSGIELKSYDFYFNYVVALCLKLKPLWDK